MSPTIILSNSILDNKPVSEQNMIVYASALWSGNEEQEWPEIPVAARLLEDFVFYTKDLLTKDHETWNSK